MIQVVVQTPMPPPPPIPPGLDPTYAFTQLLDWIGPVVILVVMVIGVRWVLKTPVGEALAERIRHGRRVGGGGHLTGESAGQVAALEAQVASLRSEVSELAERLDFAERILAERNAPRLGQGR